MFFDSFKLLEGYHTHHGQGELYFCCLAKLFHPHTMRA